MHYLQVKHSEFQLVCACLMATSQAWSQANTLVALLGRGLRRQNIEGGSVGVSRRDSRLLPGLPMGILWTPSCQASPAQKAALGPTKEVLQIAP